MTRAGPIVLAIVLAAVGALLVGRSFRAYRRAVARSFFACGGCGYPARELRGCVCPECGLDRTVVPAQRRGDRLPLRDGLGLTLGTACLTAAGIAILAAITALAAT